MSALILAFSASCLQAQEAVPAPAPDPDLPQPIDFSFADDLVMQSPFTRIVSFDHTYELTGVAYVDGQPVATVLNKETKQRFVVTQEPNPQGWALIAADAGPDLELTQVEMSVGGEIVAMHYGGNQLSPGAGPGGPKGTKSQSRMAGNSTNGGSGKNDGGKIRASAFLGEDGKKMYASLSPEARDKFKDLVQSRVEKRPELTNEQQAAYAQKIFAKLKATDQPSAKQPKTGKTPKIKQGT
ncbi:MAG: hypothetical protein ACO1TE_11105 [Prosthecobacter sp.]